MSGPVAIGRRYTDRAYAVTDIKVDSNADSVQLTVNGTPIDALQAAQCPSGRACSMTSPSSAAPTR